MIATLNKTGVMSFAYRSENMNTDHAGLPSAKPDAMDVQRAIAVISADIWPKGGHMQPSRHRRGYGRTSNPRNKEGTAIDNTLFRNAYLKQALCYSQTERADDVIISGPAR